MAERTHNEAENSRNGRHSDRLNDQSQHKIQININLISCQERGWDCFEDFTKTLTGNLPERLTEAPPENIYILFHYSCEASMFLVNGEWFPRAIHNFSKEHGIPLKNITFCSGNLRFEESYKKWHSIYTPNEDQFKCKYYNFGMWLYSKDHPHYDQITFTKEPPTHKRDFRFNCLNANMLTHRQLFMLAMYENNILNDVFLNNNIVSFHYWHDVNNRFPLPQGLLDMLPIQYDLKGDWQQVFDRIFTIQSGMGGTDWNKTGDYRFIYERSYITLTTESGECHGMCDPCNNEKHDNYFREFHRETFLTEKSTRPMLNLHPQIIYSGAGTLEYYKEKGFKTFSNYWNEDYDNEEDGKKKLQMIIDIIKDLNNKHIDEIHDMYWDMMPILKHNQQHLINMPLDYQ